MNIPMPLNAEQAAKVEALITKGDPDLVVIDNPVGGSPLYVLLARGEARDWILATISGITPETVDEGYVPDGPAAKVVAVSEGARASSGAERT